MEVTTVHRRENTVETSTESGPYPEVFGRVQTWVVSGPETGGGKFSVVGKLRETPLFGRGGTGCQNMSSTTKRGDSDPTKRDGTVY